MVRLILLNCDDSDDTRSLLGGHDMLDFDLWVDNFQAIGVAACVIALSAETESPVGFATLSFSNEVIAIEVLPECRGLGIARILINAIGSDVPQLNANPKFWEHIQKTPLTPPA
jgi:GNAT superfamily N-acetyltransferase